MSEGEIVLEIEGEEKSLHFNIVKVTNEKPWYKERPWYKDTLILFLFSLTMFILLATGVTILVVYLIE